MLPDAHLSHQINGKLRIRVPAKRGDEQYFLSVGQSLRACEGVEHVATNSVTGSVLLLMQGLGFPEIKKIAEEKGLFRLLTPSADGTVLLDSVSDQMGTLDDHIRDWSRGKVDGKSLAFTGLGGAASISSPRATFFRPPGHCFGMPSLP